MSSASSGSSTGTDQTPTTHTGKQYTQSKQKQIITQCAHVCLKLMLLVQYFINGQNMFIQDSDLLQAGAQFT